MQQERHASKSDGRCQDSFYEKDISPIVKAPSRMDTSAKETIICVSSK